ncbi:MAG: ABC transporter ATP-binding protein [Spirochaetota bacterium]|nr:ABC transporter ATP-binding protein [Spirochaetota bacterium]
MKSYYKILRNLLPYKHLLILAAISSLLFSVFNAISLYSVVPIFNTMTGESEASVFTISENEAEMMRKDAPLFIDRIKILQIKAKMIFNSYFSSKTRIETITVISLMIIPLLILKNIFDFLGRSLFAYAGNRVVQNIRKKLFEHIIMLPYSYFHRSRSGDIVSRINRDVLPLSSAMSVDLYNFISGCILLIINIIILSFVSWKLILFILILGAPIGLTIKYFGDLVKKLTKRLQEGYADISSKLQETISGIKVIKSFGAERFEEASYRRINDSIMKRDLVKRVYQNLNPSVVELLGSFVAIALFIVGGYQIIYREITSGEFIFFILLVINIFDPIKMVSNSINNAKSADAVSERIFEIFDQPIEDLNLGIDGTFKNSIQFQDVSHKYNNDYALKNVSISIPKGKSIAIVGASGSGKSTILNLIASLYSPSSGKMYIDDFSVDELSLNWIRQNVAIVTQEVFLFNGTVLENVTCGNHYIMNRVIEACKISHAHEFISKLPQGYNTVVGERGMLLSGGERQRITIARAIHSNAGIILFDEATSALDYESERLIQDSLEYLFRNSTSIIVSHKLSAINDADVIYVMADGRIIDKGSHSDLLVKSETYKKLFNNDK